MTKRHHLWKPSLKLENDHVWLYLSMSFINNDYKITHYWKHLSADTRAAIVLITDTSIINKNLLQDLLQFVQLSRLQISDVRYLPKYIS